VADGRKMALADAEKAITRAFEADAAELQTLLAQLAEKRDADLAAARSTVASTHAELQNALASEAVDTFAPLITNWLRLSTREDTLAVFDALRSFRAREQTELGTDLVAPLALYVAMVEAHGLNTIARFTENYSDPRELSQPLYVRSSIGGQIAAAHTATALEAVLRAAQKEQAHIAGSTFYPETAMARHKARWQAIRIQNPDLLAAIDAAHAEAIRAACEAEDAEVMRKRAELAAQSRGSYFR